MTGLNQSQTTEVLARYEPDDLMETVGRFLDSPPAHKRFTLRSHKTTPIEDADEIALRDDIDEFLEMCSTLEVMSLATGVVPELKFDLRTAIVDTLSDESVVQYYAVNYPTPLPTLLLAQLTEDEDGPAHSMLLPIREQSVDTTALLISFLELDARPWRNRDLQFFFDILDGYQFDGFGIDAFLSILGDADQLAHVLIGKTKIDAHELRSINGFCQFATFCEDFDQLCKRAADLPLLRSAFWLNFSYWFCERSHYLRKVTREARARLAPSGNAANSFEDLHDHMADFVVMVDKLTRTRDFALPLVESAAPLLDHWAEMHGVSATRRRRRGTRSTRRRNRRDHPPSRRDGNFEEAESEPEALPEIEIEEGEH
jgi:hypothetical protein